MHKLARFILLIAGIVAISSAAHGTIINASTCSHTDVATAIASASAGDTVVVPSGTCDWTGGHSISGITLQGAGKTASDTVITAGAVTITKHATALTRLTGFRFTGTSNHVTFQGNSGDEPFIMDNLYLFTNGGSGANRMVIGLANGGLIHHCDFYATTGTNADVFNIDTGETSWTVANGTTIGENDTTGKRNLYFEDNTFTNILETAPDADRGTRLVMRYNTFTDSSIVLHSSPPNDTGSAGNGHRHSEIYNNTFTRVSNSWGLNKWLWTRGGVVIFANNALDKADSPDGFSYPGKPELRFSVGCPTAYPIDYQVGQLYVPSDSTPDNPVLIFGNTGDGAGEANFIQIESGPVVTCGTPEDYIQSGRDYELTNTWSWVPYQYPHPLQQVAAMPGQPTSLTDTASATATMPGQPTSLTDTASSTATMPGQPTSLTDTASATATMPGQPTGLSSP